MTDLALADGAQRTIQRTVVRTSLRQSLSVELLESELSHVTIDADWRRLSEAERGGTLFQTRQVLSAWRNRFPPRPGARATTLVVRDQGRPVLIWPLLVERRAGITVVTGAGAPISQYDDLLLDPACDGAEAVRCALEAVAKKFGADCVLLERVRENSALRHALRNAILVCGEEAAPYADLSRGAEALMATLKSRVLRQQRKRVARLHKAGSVAFEIADSPREAETWLREAMAMKRKWLRDSGRVSRAFVKAETEECLADLARALSATDSTPRMIVGRLTLNGRTAAIEMGFRHRNTYHLYLGAFAADLGSFGPGNVLTQHMLEWCAANGVARYDMLAPRSRNKREWQSGEVAVLDLTLPLTWRGSLYIEVVLKRLVPRVRRAFYALPASFRSRLAGMALRA